MNEHTTFRIAPVTEESTDHGYEFHLVLDNGAEVGLASVHYAELFAASGDMLEALRPFEELANETEGFGDDQPLTVRARDVRAARAAFARAGGRS